MKMNTNKTTLALLIASCFVTSAIAQETKTLSSVVVTATRVEQDSFDLPMAIDKVEKSAIEDSQLRMTLSESLARVPGITAQNRNQMAQDPQISSRGFGARSAFGVRGVRIYVDGIPLSMPDGIGNPGSVDLDTIGSIEVMRGPFSAMYGNSSGGVIQMFTRPIPTTPEVSGDMLFGSFGTRRESVQAAGTRQGVEYLLNFSNFESDGYRAQSANEKRQATAKLGVKLSDDAKLTTLINWFDQYALDPGGLTAANLNTSYTMASPNNVAANARVIRSNKQVGFNLEKILDSQNTLNAITYVGQRDNSQFLSTGGTAGRDSVIARDFYGAELRLTHRGTILARPYTATAGVNVGFMSDLRTDLPATAGVVSGSATRNETQKADNFDQYVQGLWSADERWDIHAGVRHTRLKQRVSDHLPTTNGNGTGSTSFDKTIPVIGAVFKATPALNFYANVGKGFETPTMIEISYSDTTGNGPNLTLKPATSTNIEVGSKWYVSDYTRANIALFTINTNNEIVTQSSGTYATYRNAGKTTRQGVEISAETLLDNNLSLYGAYTYLDATFDSGSSYSPGSSIPGTYRSQLFGELAWKHQPIGFQTALEMRYNGKVYVNDANSASVDEYTIFSVRGQFRQRYNDWTLTEYARIDNLFDEKYVGSVRVNDANSRFYEPAPGRNWIMGVKASLNF
jgi:iron complex outermembrane receptor protein